MIRNKKSSGQSVVIGALLLLALFVGFIAWFQITQIPILYQNAESDNQEELRVDMFDFQDELHDSIMNNNVNQFTFSTKMNYEYQLSGFENKIGQFSVTEFSDNPIQINNVNQSISEPETVNSLKYTPSYIERTEVPFIYENNILVENRSSNSIDRSGQKFIRGTDIYLFEYDYTFKALQSVNPTVVISPKESYNEMSVTGEEIDISEEEEETELETQDIEIELVSSYDVETWEMLLRGQSNVEEITEVQDGRILVILDGGEEYTIHKGKIMVER